MKHLVLLLAASILPLVAVEKPNIIFILADDLGKEWIMALGHGHAKLDEKGVRGVHDFASRVIRDKRFKVWVSEEKKITRLHDLSTDANEETNLLDGELKEDQKDVLIKFKAVVDSLLDRDARPVYEPRAANPWDKKPN